MEEREGAFFLLLFLVFVFVFVLVEGFVGFVLLLLTIDVVAAVGEEEDGADDCCCPVIMTFRELLRLRGRVTSRLCVLFCVGMECDFCSFVGGKEGDKRFAIFVSLFFAKLIGRGVFLVWQWVLFGELFVILEWTLWRGSWLSYFVVDAMWR